MQDGSLQVFFKLLCAVTNIHAEERLGPVYEPPRARWSSLVLSLSPVLLRLQLSSKGPLCGWLAGQVFMECLSCLLGCGGKWLMKCNVLNEFTSVTTAWPVVLVSTFFACCRTFILGKTFSGEVEEAISEPKTLVNHACVLNFILPVSNFELE